jgi:hypothetical protein
MVLESVVPLPSSINPEVPPEVDRIVMRALERDREARYLTAGEMAEDLEKVLFEMRASPHEPRKLLISLFPQGPSRTGELRLPVLTPSPVLLDSGSSFGSGAAGSGSAVPSPIAVSASLSASNPTKPLTPGAGDDIEMADLAPSRSITRRRSGRRKWSLLGGVVGIVVAVVVLAHPPWAVRPSDETVTPATAQQPAAPAPAPPTPAATAAPAKATVEISLDSTPQDAQVIREDTGEVVGRTPVTIKLHQARDVISFRFEKAGHTPNSYKVIPDLDKSVRAELSPEPVEAPKHAALPPPRHGPPPRGHGPATGRDARPTASETPAAPSAEQGRNCLMSVGSFPWAELWIDGKDTGQRTPVVHYPVSCGAHKITLKRRDLNLNRSEQVTVAPDHELKQHYELSDEYGD